MAFEEGNILEDQQWQAPSSCFEKALDLPQNHALSSHMGLPSGISQQSLQSLRELYSTERSEISDSSLSLNYLI
jgi:hypothetical protein